MSQIPKAATDPCEDYDDAVEDEATNALTREELDRAVQQYNEEQQVRLPQFLPRHSGSTDAKDSG